MQVMELVCYVLVVSLTGSVRQGQRVLGPQCFQEVYKYLKMARQENAVNEAAIAAGLKNITSNIRDCFIVDQLVFLEKQAEDTSF